MFNHLNERIVAMQIHDLARRFKILSTRILVAAAFLAGFGLACAMYGQQQPAPPAYLVVSAKTINQDAIKAYGAAAEPLALAAGLEVVAGRPDPTVTVLEGEWPYDEGILIEKFTSMAALREFWYSDSYQEAKKLRKGALKVNFIVAVEGVPVD